MSQVLKFAGFLLIAFAIYNHFSSKEEIVIPIDHKESFKVETAQEVPLAQVNPENVSQSVTEKVNEKPSLIEVDEYPDRLINQISGNSLVVCETNSEYCEPKPSVVVDDQGLPIKVSCPTYVSNCLTKKSVSQVIDNSLNPPIETSNESNITQQSGEDLFNVKSQPFTKEDRSLYPRIVDFNGQSYIRKTKISITRDGKNITGVVYYRKSDNIQILIGENGEVVPLRKKHENRNKENTK